MSSKISLIQNLHKDFRQDEYIGEVLGAAGEELDVQKNKIQNAREEFFFDTMGMLGVAVYEDQLAMTTSGSIENRRNQVEAKWKTAGKCDLELLQRISNSWRNGEISVLFTAAKIEIVFVSLVGIPDDIESLKIALETAKPAHIPISYTFKFRTFGMVKALGQTTQYWKDKGYTWKDMREKEGIS